MPATRPGPVLEPELLVADEAIAMLGPSEQATMIQLLEHLQVERGCR